MSLVAPNMKIAVNQCPGVILGYIVLGQAQYHLVQSIQIANIRNGRMRRLVIILRSAAGRKEGTVCLYTTAGTFNRYKNSNDVDSARRRRVIVIPALCTPDLLLYVQRTWQQLNIAENTHRFSSQITGNIRPWLPDVQSLNRALTMDSFPASSHKPPLQACQNVPSHSQTRSQSQTLAASLLRRCHDLLSELTTVQSHTLALGKPNLVDVRQFKSLLQSEARSLEKLLEQANLFAEECAAQRGEATYGGESRHSESDNEDDAEDGISDADARVLHSLRSSNLPFYATVWNVCKTMCTDIVAISKRFHWYEDKGPNRIGRTGQDDMATLSRHFQHLTIPRDKGRQKPETTVGALQKRNVLVDIVTDNGEEWVKVSTITRNRLVFELAKLGWEAGMGSGSEGEEDETPDVRLRQDDSGADDEDMIELVKLAADMKKAAASVRVRYKHPRIRFVLPKLVEGQFPEIDRIIRDIRKTGAIVQCGGRCEDSFKSPPKDREISHSITTTPLEAVLPSLLPDPYPHRTPTLNVDCTILLALVSDVSHFQNPDVSSSHHHNIVRQVEMEDKRPLVPSEIWPALSDRALVCAGEASKRMHEIVSTIGTDTEKARTRLLMGETGRNLDRGALVSQFQQLSDHKVAADWNIPIQVVDAHAEIERGWGNGCLPRLARKVEVQLSDINTSVFLYGWVSGMMTVTSNRTVVKEIEALVEQHRGDDDDVAGPNVWVCDTARSLIGKEKNRR